MNITMSFDCGKMPADIVDEVRRQTENLDLDFADLIHLIGSRVFCEGIPVSTIDELIKNGGLEALLENMQALSLFLYWFSRAEKSELAILHSRARDLVGSGKILELEKRA